MLAHLELAQLLVHLWNIQFVISRITHWHLLLGRVVAKIQTPLKKFDIQWVLFSNALFCVASVSRKCVRVLIDSHSLWKLRIPLVEMLVLALYSIHNYLLPTRRVFTIQMNYCRYFPGFFGCQLIHLTTVFIDLNVELWLHCHAVCIPVLALSMLFLQLFSFTLNLWFWSFNLTLVCLVINHCFGRFLYNLFTGFY